MIAHVDLNTEATLANAAAAEQFSAAIHSVGLTISDLARRAGIVLAVVAIVATAATLAGCGGTRVSPGGPSGTGAPASMEKLAVPTGDQAQISQQVGWLGRVLSTRGIPTIMLQVQLEMLVEELSAAIPEKRSEYERRRQSGGRRKDAGGSAETSPATWVRWRE